MSGASLRASLLTPRAPGGIAVAALVGEGRFVAAARVLGGAPIDTQPRVRWLRLGGELLDQAVVFDRPERSTIELHVHGSEAVIRALEGVFGPWSSALSTAREQALCGALSEAQLEFALEQERLLLPFQGSFDRWVLAHSGDASALRAAQARHALAMAITSPCAVAFVGRKNAGKSTLMNRLLFAERVLTGPTPGLTRDPVREMVALDGYPYELIDTAGEGDIVDAVDARAVALSRIARRSALLVLVVDASSGIGSIERELLAVAPIPLTVRTKVDLGAAPWPADIPPPGVDVTCRDPGDAPCVRATVGAWLRRVRHLPPAGRLGGVVPLDSLELAELSAALENLAER